MRLAGEREDDRAEVAVDAEHLGAVRHGRRDHRRPSRRSASRCATRSARDADEAGERDTRPARRSLRRRRATRCHADHASRSARIAARRRAGRQTAGAGRQVARSAGKSATSRSNAVSVQRGTGAGITQPPACRSMYNRRLCWRDDRRSRPPRPASHPRRGRDRQHHRRRRAARLQPARRHAAAAPGRSADRAAAACCGPAAGSRSPRPARASPSHAVHVQAALDRRSRGPRRASRASTSGSVRLAGFPSASSTLVPAILSALAVAHPGLTTTYVEVEPPEALDLLRRGEVDVALTFGYPGDGRTPGSDPAEPGPARPGLSTTASPSGRSSETRCWLSRLPAPSDPRRPARAPASTTSPSSRGEVHRRLPAMPRAPSRDLPPSGFRARHRARDRQRPGRARPGGGGARRGTSARALARSGARARRASRRRGCPRRATACCRWRTPAGRSGYPRSGWRSRSCERSTLPRSGSGPFPSSLGPAHGAVGGAG